eukprot:352743-Chlamydomonas_euryale.AAC.13
MQHGLVTACMRSHPHAWSHTIYQASAQPGSIHIWATDQKGLAFCNAMLAAASCRMSVSDSG